MEEPSLADAETLARRKDLARAVRDDLYAVGLPVVPEGAHSSVTAGARVSVDPFDDEGGGVFVHWDVPYVLSVAGMDALFEGRIGDDPSMRLGAEASRIMQDAIAEILTAAGYDVEKDANDMSPFRSQVLRRRPVASSWRDWLNRQTRRREEALAKHARERESAQAANDRAGDDETENDGT